MDMTAGMHGPTLARDDRYAGPRAASSAAAAAQAAAAVARLRTGALHGRSATRAGASADVDAVGCAVFVPGPDGTVGVGRKRPRPAEAAVPESASGDEGPGDYFVQRARKLAHQHRVSAGVLPDRADGAPLRATTPVPALFANMRFYINGRTAGPGQEATSALGLTTLIHKYGGSTSLDAAVTRITHILAHNLNGSKAHDLAARAGAKIIPVLRPEYVTACIAAGKRLPEHEWSVLPRGASGGGGAGTTLDGWAVSGVRESHSSGIVAPSAKSGKAAGGGTARSTADVLRSSQVGNSGGEVIVLSGE